MNMTILRRFAALCAVLVLAVIMTACFEAPTVIITDQQGENNTTSAPTSTASTKPTVAVEQGTLTLSTLMGMMRETMKWSDFSNYTHTDVDDSHARFIVADSYGKECILSVTYDAEANTVSTADLSYGDTTVSVLSNNTLVIRTIMLAMNKD